jgi:hypothetical protein
VVGAGNVGALIVGVSSRGEGSRAALSTPTLRFLPGVAAGALVEEPVGGDWPREAASSDLGRL